MLILTEGDRAILCYKGQRVALTAPLRPGSKAVTRTGFTIDHEAVIGKQAREIVLSREGHEFRVHFPTLEEYLILTPRLVTPIYPADANLIVSLLDLHVSVQSQNDAAPLQILEAGTGHGALTLHLARAIHAANIDPTAHRQQLHEPAQGLVLYWLPKKALDLYWYAISLLRGRSAGHLQKHKYRPDKSISNSATPNSPAIVQTIDVSSRHSEHARMIVEGFRRGMYSKDVDFHVGSVSEWIERQLQLRSRKPFLSHAILDLPSSHNHIEKTASALYVDGSLLVFSPSITQINSTIHVVKAKKLRLQLDRVVEVGPAMTGGRVWDIRLVKPRATPDAHVSTSLNPQEEHTRQDGELRSGNGIEDHQMTEDDHNYEWVCRPKVGDRTSGGGFVALWKKNRSRNDF